QAIAPTMTTVELPAKPVHRGWARTSHRPYYATTKRPAKLVQSRGDGLSSPRGGGCQARSQYKTPANFSPFTFLVTLTVTIERRK
ncbi:MAG: hypothetical protein ACJ8CB_08355, partial [Ktedonobacteraceae bacterium]